MQKELLKIGDKVVYHNANNGEIDWFVDGSTIIYQGSHGDKGTGIFNGPAKYDDIGGRGIKENEFFTAYARFDSVEISDLVTFTEEVVAIRTTITVKLALTDAQKTAIRRIAMGD